MIGNNPRRSLEFFRAPIQSGREAKSDPLALRPILMLHALRAVLLSLGAIALHWASIAGLGEESAQIIAPDGEEQIGAMLGELIRAIYERPLLLFLIYFANSLLVTSILFIVARNFSPVKSWLIAQSALIRFGIVTAFLHFGTSLIAAAFMLLSGELGKLVISLNAMISIGIMVLWVLVTHGIFELETPGTTILVFVLTFLSLIGVLFFLQLLALPFLGLPPD